MQDSLGDLAGEATMKLSARGYTVLTEIGGSGVYHDQILYSPSAEPDGEGLLIFIRDHRRGDLIRLSIDADEVRRIVERRGQQRANYWHSVRAEIDARPHDHAVGAVRILKVGTIEWFHD